MCFDLTSYVSLIIKVTNSFLFLNRYLEPDLRSVMHAVIQNNGYFAHCENVVLSMLCDKKPEVRNAAVVKIISARKQSHFTGEFFFLFALYGKHN